jgi:hypothetical protein
LFINRPILIESIERKNILLDIGSHLLLDWFGDSFQFLFEVFLQVGQILGRIVFGQCLFLLLLVNPSLNKFG